MKSAEQVYQEKPWLRHYPPGVPHGLEYPEVPLHQVLAGTARAGSRKAALVFFGRTTSYGGLLDEVRRVAGGLARLGLRKGDRVAIMLPNCPQLVAAYFGVLWAGGVVVMVNPLYTASELQFQLEDSGARFLLVLDQLYPRAAEAAEKAGTEKTFVTGIQERLPFPLNILYPLKLRREGKLVKVPCSSHVLRYAELAASSPLEQPVAVDPKADLALLQYTGGTTGTPKGVMLTHFNLVANAAQLRAWTPSLKDAQTTILGVLPFFHTYGMTTVMDYGIMVGARLLLFPRFEVKGVLRAIQKYRPQLFPGVPTMYVAINNHPEARRFRLDSIRWCVSGAAPLPLEVKQTFERLTGGRLVEGYGLTEASPVTHSNPLEGLQKPGSIGLPMPDTQCIIADVDTGRPLPPGEAGELLVRGPQVMQGYWRRPEETVATLAGGWLHTGDIARMDEDGYFYIVDRKKEMIIASGFKVYPRDVEEALYQHPAVKEAAVIGVPDQYRGETVKAFVVLKAGVQCSASEIIDWCRGRLAAYKVPRQVEIVAELPKSMVGKVLRRVLVEQERARQAQQPAGP